MNRFEFDPARKEKCPGCGNLIEGVLGEPYARVCFHCQGYISDCRDWYKDDPSPLTDRTLLTIEVLKGNEMIEYCQIVYSDYRHFSHVINHYLINRKATEILIDPY